MLAEVLAEGARDAVLEAVTGTRGTGQEPVYPDRLGDMRSDLTPLLLRPTS